MKNIIKNDTAAAFCYALWKSIYYFTLNKCKILSYSFYRVKESISYY